MYVGVSLLQRGFQLASTDEGPDFSITKNAQRAWVECIACMPGEGEDRVPPMLYGTVQRVPEEEMRWSAASRRSPGRNERKGADRSPPLLIGPRLIDFSARGLPCASTRPGSHARSR
jgi:hypothetical protein